MLDKDKIKKLRADLKKYGVTIESIVNTGVASKPTVIDALKGRTFNKGVILKCIELRDAAKEIFEKEKKELESAI